MILVSPFPIDLVFPGIERTDAALERLVLLGEAQDLRFDPVSRGGAYNLVPSSPCGAQLLGNTPTLPPTDQDLVVDESFELTHGLLEVPLLAFLDIPLVHKHGFIHCIVQGTWVHCRRERISVSRLKSSDLSGQRRIECDVAVEDSPCHESLDGLETGVFDQRNRQNASLS